jgi:hypothetical protein
MVLGERFLSFMSSIIRRRSGVMSCSRVEVKGGSFHDGGGVAQGVRSAVTQRQDDMVYRTEKE